MNCGSRMVRSGMVGGMVGNMGVGCKGDSHGHNGDGSDLKKNELLYFFKRLLNTNTVHKN